MRIGGRETKDWEKENVHEAKGISKGAAKIAGTGRYAMK